LLAGRKLLLADDSITIQKVVDLTFVDEGVTVLCLNNGREAIEQLADFMPDVVLADVLMPEVNGYELCEYIKNTDELKHIPVMLLVGSFEPFDEEEARRVGANDTLTKPFQSIRRLIEKVGLLSANRPPEEQIPTAELPRADDEPERPVETLNTAELEMTTADTRPLQAELRHVVDNAALAQARERETASTSNLNSEASESTESSGSMGSMEMETTRSVAPQVAARETLLDLGDIGDMAQPRQQLADDFVLDLDLDEVPEPAPMESAFAGAGYRSRDRHSMRAVTEPSFAGVTAPVMPEPTPDQLARTQEFERITDEPLDEAAHQTNYRDAPIAEIIPAEDSSAGAMSSAPESSPVSAISAEQLSPEMIDAIARRAVEHMSEKVIQEIAWEVVPQLAELLIKRQLEEKSS
jgi:CheY-like chemotaxis protein